MQRYAVFTGDSHYHLVEAKSDSTLCGLPTLMRWPGGDEYHPPARVTREKPPASLYRSCPHCVAAENSRKLRATGRDEKEGAGE